MSTYTGCLISCLCATNSLTNTYRVELSSVALYPTYVDDMRGITNEMEQNNEFA